jgi:hypothetical protein
MKPVNAGRVSMFAALFIARMGSPFTERQITFRETRSLRDRTQSLHLDQRIG